MPRKQSFSYKTSENIEKKSVKPVIYFLLIFITIFTVLNMRNTEVVHNVLPLATVSDEPESYAELTLAIRKKLQDEEGTYSIRFEDFNSRNAFGINDEQIVTAASVMKVPVLAALYTLADEGELDLDETIAIPEEDMQRWGTGVIRYEEAGTSYSYRELAQVLMERSDNTAVYVLVKNVIGVDRINELTAAWGMSNTDYMENDTSNKDMNTLMRMMYNGDIVSDPDLNDEMIGWMDDSEFEERLPKLLPEDVDVYHKIGNEVRVTNDAGIIDLDGKPYYLGIFGKDIPDHDRATEVIAEISQMVFEYQFQHRD